LKQPNDYYVAEHSAPGTSTA